MIACEFAFLLEKGYTFAGVHDRITEAIGTSLEGSFSNEAINRFVRVVFLPNQNGPRAVAVTRIELCVPERLDDFDYTSLNMMEVSVTHFSLIDDPAAGLRQHMCDAANMLRTLFLEVLDGVKWQPDHLNWGDLK